MKGIRFIEIPCGYKGSQYINVDHIVAVIPRGDYTEILITYDGHTIQTDLSVDAIMNMIYEVCL